MWWETNKHSNLIKQMVPEGSASSESSRFKSQVESGETWLIDLSATLLVKSTEVVCTLTESARVRVCNK